MAKAEDGLRFAEKILTVLNKVLFLLTIASIIWERLNDPWDGSVEDRALFGRISLPLFILLVIDTVVLVVIALIKRSRTKSV